MNRNYNLNEKEIIKEILVVGKFPPPIGGVTIHTRRLVELLERGSYQVSLINIRCIRRLLSNCMRIKKVTCKSSIVHYQLNNWLELFFLSKLVSCSLVTTVHSFRWDRFSLVKRMAFKSLVSHNDISAFIAPSLTIKKLLMDKGVKESIIYVIPTYLPPVYDEIYQAIPEDIYNFLIKNKNKKKCILASASSIVIENNVDIYGLDMCISVCERNKDLSFVFCAAQGNELYIERMKQRIQDSNMSGRFLLYIGDIYLPSLYRYFDLFVRPTSTDSYGISVEEAIQSGIKAIASDVCERAKGAFIFKARNLNDFESKIFEALNCQEESFEIKEEQSYLRTYILLYDNLLKNNITNLAGSE